MSGRGLSIISDVIQEIMSVYSVPGSMPVGRLFDSFQRRRESQGRDILMKRLAEGKIEPFEAACEDDLISVVYSYMMAAKQGMARANLDLLAQAIAGEIKGPGIHPDSFHKYMNVLSSLTRDEILVIGTYIRCNKLVYEEAKNQDILFMGTVKPNAWNKLISELVPSSLPTEEHVSVICGSLLRTGITSALPPTLGHPASHSFTILLKEISNLIDFEKAYREYPDY